MKILAFTDLHTDKNILKELDDKVKDADLLVCTGDIAWLGHGAEEMIEYFDSWNKPMLLIHGNHEFEEDIEESCKKSNNIEFLHKKIIIKEKVMFIGWGGDWYNQVSQDFEIWIEENLERIKNHKGKIILMVHMPVFNTKQDFIHGAHRGNASYRAIIERLNPDLVFCGHFHETFHIKDNIGNALIVNPGQDGELFEL